MKYFLALLATLALLFSFASAVDKADCLLDQDVGPCRKADLKFFYNAKAQECQEFFYGGCHGNNNRFQTKEDCEKACM